MAKKSKRAPAQKRKSKAASRRVPIQAASQQANQAADRKPEQTTGRKIFPRNLTAQANYLVPGNPVVTRPEAAVANCFPGLELDVRNLDRRFFPGLVFNFVDSGLGTGGKPYGAKLAYVDVQLDPDLIIDSDTIARVRKILKRDKDSDDSIGKLIKKLSDKLIEKRDDSDNPLSTGNWYLEWIEQGERLSVAQPVDGLTVWRIVRGLEPGPVKIRLQRRDGKGGVTLTGWRRFYTDPTTGVISSAYQPGELMQGLCSPWQHDFRDCACHYWAANHPDVAFAEVYPGEPTLPGDSDDLSRYVRLDWLRADRSREMASAALDSIPKNRPYQFDHFQINRAWQDLSIVLEGREVGAVYVPTAIENANPLANIRDLIEELEEWLAPLELTLILEYLYARFSLLTGTEVRRKGGGGQLADAVDFARKNLLLIATSEMHHLRWANEMLWKLYEVENNPHFKYKPVLKVCELVPNSVAGIPPDQLSQQAVSDVKLARQTVADFVRVEHKVEFHPRALKVPTRQALAEFKKDHPDIDPPLRPPELRPLGESVVANFIAIEHPSSFIDGAYAKIIATLRQSQYPKHLLDLAMRIAAEGMDHENLFIQIRAALAPFEEPEYLRTSMKIGAKAETPRAIKALDTIIDRLTKAYEKAASEKLEMTNPDISAARAAMDELLEVGENLARFGTEKGAQGNKSIGIPLFSRWDPQSASPRSRTR